MFMVVYGRLHNFFIQTIDTVPLSQLSQQIYSLLRLCEDFLV